MRSLIPFALALVFGCSSAWSTESEKTSPLPFVYNLVKGTTDFESYLRLVGLMMNRADQMTALMKQMDAATLKQRPTNVKLVKDDQLKVGVSEITWKSGVMKADDVTMVYNPRATLLENFKTFQLTYTQKHKTAWLASWLPEAEADSGLMGLIGLIATTGGLGSNSPDLVNLGVGLLQSNPASPTSGPSATPREEIPLAVCINKDGKSFENSFYNVVTKKNHYEEISPYGDGGYKLILRDETSGDIKGKVNSVYYIKAVGKSYEMENKTDGEGNPKRFWMMDGIARRAAKSYRVCFEEGTRKQAQQQSEQIRRDIASGKISLAQPDDLDPSSDEATR